MQGNSTTQGRSVVDKKDGISMLQYTCLDGGMPYRPQYLMSTYPRDFPAKTPDYRNFYLKNQNQEKSDKNPKIVERGFVFKNYQITVNQKGYQT